MLTSNSPADRSARRTWWFVYGVWAAMTLQALVFVILYPHTGPIIDEWDFIEAVTGEEPFWPWLWKLHNEHRFVLPRLIWLPLTQISGDFRTGCYVSLIGVSALSVLMTRLAARLRGRLHFADAFFPVTLLHVGHWENFRMGYQIVFMMNLFLAAILLQVVLTTNRSNLMRKGVQGGIVTLLLLGCGAGGLAFGPFMAFWFVALVIWFLRRGSQKGIANAPGSRWRALLVLGFTALIPLYIWLYLQGFARPGHHADPLEVWGSRSETAWQALRSAMQALSMAFGPAAIGLWPVSAFIIGLGVFECVLHLLRTFIRNVQDRPRILGLLLYFTSVVFMGYGIGWGRCVFTTDDGSPGFMGMSSRYGWIVWPGLAAFYFQWLVFGSPRFSRWVPILLFGIAVVMLPFNVVTGFKLGIEHRELNAGWEQSVRDGMSERALIEKYFPDYYDELRKHMEHGVFLLRKHHFQYYRPTNAAPQAEPKERKRSDRARPARNQAGGGYET